MTEPERTSPAANTPGRLVSSRNGCRRAVQWGDCARAGPVRTNSLASLSISGGSQSVRGTAPMKLNSAGVFSVRTSPVLLLTSSTSLEVAVAGHPPDLGVEEHLDVGGLLDPAGQVARHVLVEVVAADHEVDLAHLPGEEDGGLAGGVAAADDHHLRPPAHLRLDGRRGVVDAAALELLAPFDAQQAVVGPGGDQQALGRDRLAAVEVQHRVGVVERQSR